jgi:hypothetical protein
MACEASGLGRSNGQPVTGIASMWMTSEAAAGGELCDRETGQWAKIPPAALRASPRASLSRLR